MFDGCRAAGVDFSDVITLAQLRRFEAREPGAAECDADAPAQRTKICRNTQTDATDDANMEWEMQWNTRKDHEIETGPSQAVEHNLSSVWADMFIKHV